MPKNRVDVPESTLAELLSRSNNRCCVCQTPFVVVHHVDNDPSNNDADNLAPLCPNCHSQAHSKGGMHRNLTQDRIKRMRDIWYSYCDQRQETDAAEPRAVARLIAFVQYLENGGYLPPRSWKKTFGVFHPEYANMSKLDMAERLFSTTNRADLVTYLEAVKGMYAELFYGVGGVEEKFVKVCSAFGIDFDELV